MTDTSRLAVNELFYSLQGEGDYAGTPMVFIRFAGCNLACEWCDQPDTIHEGFVDRLGQRWSLMFKRRSVQDVVLEVQKYPTSYVCLTGGEPMAHKLGELIGELHKLKKTVHMESNGTLEPSWLAGVDHLV